jgi:hypothetical protein
MNPTNWVQVFKIAGGIGSGIGALCFLGALFSQYATRREEHSISKLIGHTQLPPEDVLQILREFKDDAQGRLKALEVLLHGQREQAHQLLEKLKSGIDIDKVMRHHDQGTLRLLKSIGVVTGMLGVLLLVVAFIQPASTPVKTEPPRAKWELQSGVLKVRAFIDGNDVLTISTNVARWTHRDNVSNVPGTWQGNYATFINDVPYFPTFPGERQIGESSEMMVIPPLPADSLDVLGGNSKTSIGEVNVSSPAPGTLVVGIAKYAAPGGAKWFDIAIPWKTKPPE